MNWIPASYNLPKERGDYLVAWPYEKRHIYAKAWWINGQFVDEMTRPFHHTVTHWQRITPPSPTVSGSRRRSGGNSNSNYWEE